MHCATISCYDVWVDIIIPLLSAVLGGAITMWGVVHTIKHEQKNSEEQTRLSVKPWLFSVDDDGTSDTRNANFYLMQAEEYLSNDSCLSFLIRNTDNGVAILEKFQTKNNTYTPYVGKILDKNTVTYLQVRIAPEETLENMYLYIKDIYGNTYYYRADIGEASEKTCTLTEVKGISNFGH